MAEPHRHGAAARGAEGDVYFEHAPVPLWLEDLSAVRTWAERLRAGGVSDLGRHLRRNPRAVADCLSRIRVLDVNEAAVRLYGAPDRASLLRGLERIVRPAEVVRAVGEVLEALLSGERQVEVRSLQRTWTGEPLRVGLAVSLLPEGRGDWSRVLVAVQDVTALARMRDRLRALHEATPDAVLVRDPQGRIVEANGSAARIFACPREALLQRPIESLVAGGGAASDLREAVRQAESGQAVDAEWTARGCDGREFPVEARLRPLVGLRERGRLPVLCVLRDIGERRRAEATLRESEAKFRDLAEKALVGVYLIQDGRLKYANPRLAEIFGYGVDELVGRVPVADLVHPDDRGLVAESIRRRIAGEIESLHYRFRGLRSDGQVIQVEVYGTRTLFQGRPAVLGTLLDVTAQLEAEARERRLREGLLALGRWTRRLLGVRADEEGFHRLACEGAREIVSARTVAFTRLEDGRVRYEYAMGEACRCFEGLELELEESGLCGWVAHHRRAVRVDDLARDSRVQRDLASGLRARAALVVPILMEGEVTGGIAAYRDEPFDEVDERLLMLYAERVGTILENLRLLRTLERRVRERTAELEAANRELESFAYSVSHDLRAPLRAIDGFVRAVLEDHGARLPPEGQAHLERVRHAAQRMGRLIDDLLMLSRVTRREMVRRPVDLSALAREVASELAEREPGRRMTVRIAPGMRAEGDPSLLRLLLENLLGNAWKYTRPCPDAVIEVGCEQGPGGGGMVYFVRDNGVGFDMRYAERLFAPFQRLHRDDEFEGTGVGLATVQRIVHRHGGRVWAEAEPGRGAIFRFTLAPDRCPRAGAGGGPRGRASPGAP